MSAWYSFIFYCLRVNSAQKDFETRDFFFEVDSNTVETASRYYSDDALATS